MEVQKIYGRVMTVKITLSRSVRLNWAFNADANIGHAFGIFMASVGALRALRSGAG
ncbi:MAG: hypothetical protein ACLGID_16270 [Gammaproteobacteria bacterium]